MSARAPSAVPRGPWAPAPRNPEALPARKWFSQHPGRRLSISSQVASFYPHFVKILPKLFLPSPLPHPPGCCLTDAPLVQWGAGEGHGQGVNQKRRDTDVHCGDRQEAGPCPLHRHPREGTHRDRDRPAPGALSSWTMSRVCDGAPSPTLRGERYKLARSHWETLPALQGTGAWLVLRLPRPGVSGTNSR